MNNSRSFFIGILFIIIGLQTQAYTSDLEGSSENRWSRDSIYVVMEPSKGVIPVSFIWPVEWNGISSSWGRRKDPISGRESYHRGVDIPLFVGTSVYAPEEGRVRIADTDYGYGKYIVIDHRGGYSTMFAHLDNYIIKKDDIVKKGEKIGETGATGVVTGPHLHYEVRRHEADLDPREFLLVKR